MVDMGLAGTSAPLITARARGLVGCKRCARVWPLGTSRCGRCGARLARRDGTSLHAVWAWWLAGAMAYIPAQLYPMLETRTLLHKTDDTIIAGAVKIAAHGSWGIAIIILTASVLIPLIKFAAIAILALSVRNGSTIRPSRRFFMYEIVEYIGRWSMIDVFVVAILSSLVQLNVVASIRPGPAAATFALSVVFTMLSAQAFDSRLLWDARHD